MEIKRANEKISISLEGREIGNLTYRNEEGVIYVDSTFVNPAHRGKNYAKMLVDEVVEVARENDFKIVPICPYVVKVLNREDKYNDVLKI